MSNNLSLNLSNNIYFDSFNNQATAYDSYNAYLLAVISEKTYRQEKVARLGGKNETNEDWAKRIKEEGKAWGFKRTYCFNHKGSQAILLVDSEKMILGFRGSEERSDWTNNMNRIKNKIFQETLGILVHTGFYDYVLKIWQPYNDPKGRKEGQGIKAILLEEIQDKPKSLWLTGHSLGGAAAAVTAALCVLENVPIEIAGIYTFGQPRVGDTRFANWFNERFKDKTFRFVNHNDGVPKIPTVAPLFFFKHVGQMKHITEKGKIKDAVGASWWEKLIDKLKGLDDYILEKSFGLIADHNMSTGYLAAVLKELKELSDNLKELSDKT
ncbi:MAG: lipase family protein [Nostocaceae cyanobacterium]|nr:lipase family protein [Nostocaceae cyanobacterium]